MPMVIWAESLYNRELGKFFKQPTLGEGKKMICPSCEKTIVEQSKFCSECGSPLADQDETVEMQSADSSQNTASDHASPSGDEGRGSVLRNFTNKVHKAAGFKEPVEIRLRDLFSETFKKHTEEDAEKLFIVGTSRTTPTMDELIDTWPRPWLFMRIFIIVAIVYGGFYLGFGYFQNLNLLPGLIIVGSFLMPISLLIFFWEINAPQNIPIYRVAYFVILAGMLSLIIALLFFDTLGMLGRNVIFIGLIEEAAKVLAILFCLRHRNYHFILNGLLVGAAVGAGFAAFESAGYALRIGMQDMNSMFTNIFLRGLLAPGGHIVWAALSGAAICMVKGQRKWEWSMLKDMRFLRIFLIVSALHAIWNSPLSSALFPFSYLLNTAVSWTIAFAMISIGLKEISVFKQRYLEERDTLLLVDGVQADQPDQTAEANPSLAPSDGKHGVQA